MGQGAWKVRLYTALPRRARAHAARWGTPNFTIGACGLITRDGSDLLLVRPVYRDGWMPPGGFLARGETPSEALVREIVEELGVAMTFDEPHRVAFESSRQVVTFMSAGLAPAGADFRICSDELSDVGWFPLDQLPALANDFTEGIPDADLAAVRRFAESGQAGPHGRDHQGDVGR